MTRTVKTADIELQVLDRGAGMPIVLAHGFALDHSMWEAQIEHLERRWRVIAVDLRGFGGSQVVPGVADMSQMAEDINGLLDALDIREPIVFCGLSMGGYVAQHFWRNHAARLRGLALCDTRAAADTPEGIELRMKMIEHVLAAGTGYVAEAMLPKMYAPQTFQSCPDVIEAGRRAILASDPQGIAAALRGMAQRPDMRGELPKIALPTLVVVGEHDAISSVDEMRGMAQAIPKAQFVVIPQAGHMSPQENPAAFNAALDEFLTRLDRAG
jgi:3-oxoadipate enol-lactonase